MAGEKLRVPGMLCAGRRQESRVKQVDQAECEGLLWARHPLEGRIYV